MLQNIRDHSTGWFSWVVIGAIIIVFALFGITRYLGGGQTENVVAVVNDKAISETEVSHVYYQLRQQAQENKTFQSTQQFAKALKKQALAQLIHTTALMQSAADNGFMLSPVVVQAALESLPFFQENGKFSPEKWQQFMVNNPNAERIVAQIKTNELLNQVRQGFVETSFVLPQQFNQFQALLNQERDVNYITVPFSRFNDDNTHVSIAQEQAYYQAHKAAFTTPAEVKLDYITLSVKSLMAKIQPSEAKLKAFYASDVSHYQEPEQWRLGKIEFPVAPGATPAVVTKIRAKAGAVARQLESEANFAELAKANQGVEMPWVSSRTVGPALKRAIASLTKVGSVSMPLRTPEGYVIYKLLDKKPAKQLTFNQVKSRLLIAYRQEKAQQQFEKMSDQLANLTFSEPSSLAPAAKKLGLSIQTTAYFSKEGKGEGILKDPDVVHMAFSNDVLTNRNNSPVINLSNNTQLVLRVADYKPEATKPFSKVKTQIHAALLKKAKMDQARSLATHLAKEIQSGKSVQALARASQLSLIELGYVKRQASGKHSNIIHAAFLMPLSEKVKPVPSDDGFVVVMVNGVKAVKAAKPDIKQDAFLKKALVQQKGALAYDLYAQSVVKSAAVKVQDKTWQ